MPAWPRLRKEEPQERLLVTREQRSLLRSVLPRAEGSQSEPVLPLEGVRRRQQEPEPMLTQPTKRRKAL